MPKRGNTFPVGYVHPPTETVVDAPCHTGGKAHRPALNHDGPAAACGAQPYEGGWRRLGYYAAIDAGAKPCRQPQCFPRHLEST